MRNKIRKKLNKKTNKIYFEKTRIDYIGEKVLRLVELENNIKIGYEIVFKKNIPVKIIKWKAGKRIERKNLKVKSLLKNFKNSFKIGNDKCIIRSFSDRENLKSELVEVQTELKKDKIEIYIIQGYDRNISIYPMFELRKLNK